MNVYFYLVPGILWVSGLFLHIDEGGLSTGAVVGIAVGTIVGIVVVIAIILLVVLICKWTAFDVPLICIEYLREWWLRIRIYNVSITHCIQAELFVYNMFAHVSCMAIFAMYYAHATRMDIVLSCYSLLRLEWNMASRVVIYIIMFTYLWFIKIVLYGISHHIQLWPL